MEESNNTPKTTSPGLASPEKQKALWSILSRYDQYIAATNTKAAFILAFDAATLTLLANWFAKPAESTCHQAACLLGWWQAFLTLLAIVVVINIYLTLRVVEPNTTSPTSNKGYKSLIFFGDVARHDASDYRACIGSISDEEFGSDLAIQVRTIAGILDSKFAKMKFVFSTLFYIQIPFTVAATVWKVLHY